MERAWALTKIFQASWSKVGQDGVASCTGPQAPTEFMTKVPQRASLPLGFTSFPATQRRDPKPSLPDRASVPLPRRRRGLTRGS